MTVSYLPGKPLKFNDHSVYRKLLQLLQTHNHYYGKQFPYSQKLTNRHPNQKYVPM